MAYSLFGGESNFTEMLFGKTDCDIINERDESTYSRSSGCSSPTHSTDSGSSSNNIDSTNNLFLWKVLDSLLEVCHDGYKIHLATHLPPALIGRPASRTFPAPAPPPQPMTYQPMTCTVPPPPCHPQYTDVPSLLPHHERLHHFVPVPLIPTPQMMSIPPPPIRYYNP